jgi:hypothetical protein
MGLFRKDAIRAFGIGFALGAALLAGNFTAQAHAPAVIAAHE